MADHILERTSESEQMYLITIASLIEGGLPEPIPLSAIAQELSVLPVSVNQMVRKLEKCGLLHYSPYKGVELTPQGRQIAVRTLRNRRLWEVFLVEQLNLPVDEADQLACTMEHITSDEIAHRLSIHLGEPTTSPSGKRIPQADSELEIKNWIQMKDLDVGSRAQITQIKSGPSVQSFLHEQGILPGTNVIIKAIGKNGTRLITVNGGFVQLAEEITADILIDRSTSINTSVQDSSSKSNH